MRLEIKVEGLDKLTAGLKEFPAALKRATRNAVDTTATAVKNIGVDEAERVYNIKRARLTKDQKGRPTTYVKRSTQTELHASVIFKGGSGQRSFDRIGLRHFAINKAPARREKGWKPLIKIKRDGGTEAIDRGFYAAGAGFRRGVMPGKQNERRLAHERGFVLFQRDPSRRMGFTNYETGKRTVGQLIVARTGPGLKQMVEQSEVMAVIESRGKAVLKEKVMEAVEKQLKKIKGKG